MRDTVIAALAAHASGILIGIWLYSPTLRMMLHRYHITLEDGYVIFTPHSPTPEKEHHE